MRRVIALAAVLVLGAINAPSHAITSLFLNSTCTASTKAGVTIAPKTAKAPNGTADVAGVNKIDRIPFTITDSGEHYLAVWGLTDPDIAVCKRSSSGTYSIVCTSENTPPLADGCVIVDDLNGQNPGIGPPLPGNGTYQLFVFNCGGSPGCDGLPEHPSPYTAAWA